VRLEILALLFFGGTVTLLAAPDKSPLVLEEVPPGVGCGCNFYEAGMLVFAQRLSEDNAGCIATDGVEHVIARVSGHPGDRELFQSEGWSIDVRFHDAVDRPKEEGTEYRATIHVVTSSAEALVETTGGCGC
jgi:hypothetical protein